MNKSELWRRMKNSKFFVIGAVGVILVVVIALIAPFIAPYDPVATDLTARLQAPDGFSKGLSGHILGTDALGMDVLSRILIGSQSSLKISLLVVISTAVVGTILGIVAGFYGGIVDTIIMRISDIQLSIPPLILAIAVMSVLGNSINNLIFVFIVTGWVQYSRIVRGSVMMIRNTEFIHAAQILGSSKIRTMFTQVLPNVMTSLIIVTSQQFGRIIMTEASMSFLGLGVPPPTPAWGVMIADGREYLSTAPWVVVAPSIALMIAVLAFNFLGDGVRDVLDPKTR